MYVERKLQRKTLMVLTLVLLVSMFLASCSSSRQDGGSYTNSNAYANPHRDTVPNAESYANARPNAYLSTHSFTFTNIGHCRRRPEPFQRRSLGAPELRYLFRNITKGNVLKMAVAHFHSQGVRVMLSLCQWATDSRLYNTSIMNDAAQSGPDAVQCGNEQMKAGQYNRYVPPAIFAKFFDLCGSHARRAPWHPHYYWLTRSACRRYRLLPTRSTGELPDSMQYCMNTSVHPGGHWNWRSQIVGLIDSWHNGYPGQYVNSLYGLFNFWSQQFGVDLNSGGLGKHLWVIEGTGCIYGCGIATDSYDMAVSHILTLITDVQTAMRYKVPFFYFSARDFYSQGSFWPMGVRDNNDQPKPLRQDLWMGARTLTMSCSSGSVVVSSQEQLLARMYAGCTLPGNYMGILES